MPSLRVWLATLGVVSMLGQVVLLRELEVAFYGSELIYVLALGVWLAWTASGAAVARRRSRPSAAGVRWLLVVMAVALPATIVFARGLRRLFGAVPGAYLPFVWQLVGMVLALMPVGIGLGLLFQWAAKRYVREGRTLAEAYVVESLGAVAGGLAATLLLQWGVQNFTAGILAAMLALAAACVPWREGRPTLLAPLTVPVGVALVLVLIFGGRLDRAMTRWNHPALAATRDTPYGRVTLDATQGQISIFANDALAFDNQETAAAEFVHVAALAAASPRRVLVLGGGFEGLVRELLQHGPESIDYVELDRALLDAVRPSLDERDRQALDHPSVRTIFADPRRYLERTGEFDLILVGMPEPDSGQANRYYTREFFRLCRARLAENGVLALRLRASENIWTPLQAHRLASVHGALRGAIPHTLTLPVSGVVLLASPSPLPDSADPLVERLQTRGVVSPFVIPAYLRYLYTNDRFAEIAGLLERTEAPVNSDLRPVCYSHTLLIWLSAFYPALAQAEVPEVSVGSVLGSTGFAIAAVALVAAALVARRRPLARRAALAAAAGLAGMILEATLLLHYQTQRGVLFRDLGVLLTLFMAGLAAGAAIVDRRARRAGGSPRIDGWIALVLLLLMSLKVALFLVTESAPGMFSTGVLLIVTGVLVAALFAHASLRGAPDQHGMVSPLYSADLAGGCIGSLLASLLLVPLLGLPASAACAAAVALLALLVA